jgi:hypothetical protein
MSVTLAAPVPCATCRAAGPTKYVELYQNIGMLIARRTISVKQHLCRNCIGRYFKSYTLTTLILGWWGTISFFITPLILVNNCVRFLLAAGLPRPSMAATNQPIDAPFPPIDSTSSKFKYIYGTVVIIALLGVLAYHNVDFMERHAPSLNAMLHGGEVTDDQDAEYRGSKWSDDASAVLADTKSQDWPAYRSEILSRAPSFADLSLQNDKLQATFAKEREKRLDAGDPCEQLALSEFGPAMDDLTKAENEKFALVQRTTTPDDESRSSLKALNERQEAAVKRIQTYADEDNKQGCNK